MNLSYSQAMDFLGSLPVFTPQAVADKSQVMNLDSIRILLERLHNPQEKLSCIHVAGTNGKGSFCAFLGQILKESRIKTGCFTSPALFRFTETITADGKEIETEAVGRLMTVVKKEADHMAEEGIRYPSEFELTLALAFLYFAEKKCELVILETGLGGSMDATNIIVSPCLAVITSISFDHMQLLGNTLSLIAEKKAGIIKEHTDVLNAPQEAEVMQVLQKACSDRGALLHTAHMPGQVKRHDKMQTFTLDGVGEVSVTSVADYQTENAALAVSAALILEKKGYGISNEAIRKGLVNTRWRGRFEFLGRNPDVIADGAHNIQGIQALARNLHRLYPDKKIHFVTGVFSDKQYRDMMDELLPLAGKFYAITPPSPRALDKEKLSAYLKDKGAVCETAESAEEALIKAKKEAGVVCVCGSLSFLGQVYGE